MFGIDIGDDGDVRRQFEKRAVAFVGLHHHPVAGAKTRIRAIGVDDAAVDHGRIEAAGVEQRRNERGRRRLAMRAGDGDALLEAHQLGQHFGAAHDRQTFFARHDKFGIVALDRGRDDDDRGVAEIFRVMSDADRRALFDETLDVGVFGGVRSLHLVAEIEQHFGDSRHADAADADEVNGAQLVRQFHS